MADMPPEAFKPPVYLTFDDGPVLATREVLDVLADEEVTATFFLCVASLEKNESLQFSLIRRMLVEGHTLGNHGYDHDPMTKKGYRASTTAAVKDDFTRNDDKLVDMFARHDTVFPGFQVARLPGDGRTFPSFVQMITREVGVPHASWDTEFSTNGLMRHVNHANWLGVKGVSSTRRGLPNPRDILLLHDRHWHNKSDMLAELIEKLSETFFVTSLVPVPPGLTSIRYGGS